MITVIFLFVVVLILGILFGGETLSDIFYKGVGCLTWVFFFVVGLFVLILVTAD